MVQLPTEKQLDTLKSRAAMHRRIESLFLFNLSSDYFPEDQQKEARVLIKEVKERLCKLRSMLGTSKGEISNSVRLSRQPHRYNPSQDPSDFGACCICGGQESEQIHV